MNEDIAHRASPDLDARQGGRVAQAHPSASLCSSLDALGVSVDIWDQDGRLLGHSERCRPEIDSASKAPQDVPALQQYPQDRWFKCFHMSGPDGYLMDVHVDVTALVRLGRRLEASNRRLNRLSATDGLTGLANRRYLDAVLTSEWQRATRNGTNLSLLMIDIDNFKSYNDQYGHIAGDDVLRRLAGILMQCTRRSGELAARYGGEEFVLVLPGADLLHAQEVAEMCMRLMALEAVPHRACESNGYLTVSIGVACLQDHCVSSVRELIQAADVALYRAKAAGRARYMVAALEDWATQPDSLRRL